MSKFQERIIFKNNKYHLVSECETVIEVGSSFVQKLSDDKQAEIKIYVDNKGGKAILRIRGERELNLYQYKEYLNFKKIRILKD